jgi:hypothetical protein
MKYAAEMGSGAMIYVYVKRRLKAANHPLAERSFA